MATGSFTLNRRIREGLGGLSVGLALALAGCDYSRPTTETMSPGGRFVPGTVRLPGARASTQTKETVVRDPTEKAAILSSSIELIQRAALQPGGDNFRLATQKLNQYFEGTPAQDYQIPSPARAFLREQLPENMLREVEKPTWTLRDARHLEDTMMYYGIASRVGGTGDDLSRALRVFDWVVQQIQLVPAGSLGSRQFPQAIARPYDVLLRGVGTESEGFWAERSWLFIVLCRQLGIDAGLVTYTRGNILEPRLPKATGDGQQGSGLLGQGRPPKPAIAWLCAALIEGKAYLFDARIGMPVPGPGGEGVATLDQAFADPTILERMNLPGQSPYGTSRASLLASPTKISILIDSSQGLFSPKMNLLQRELPGKNRTVLYRDPSEQRDHFAQVLGNHFGAVRLWQIPLEVETRLFTDAPFVESTKQSLYLFRPEFPLVFARIKQLRGELKDAVAEYVSFRLNENVTQVNDKKKVIAKPVQEGMNVYATYYLALAHLERKDLKQAEDMFLSLLRMVPDPGPSQPYYNMFRWGAHANLGRIYEDRRDRRPAIAHYTEFDPTMQYHGSLLRARELVWEDPTAEVPDPLPPAPKTFGVSAP
jgi:hypothetical protein